MEKKEKRNIYNVTFNEKQATSIKTDLEAIENAIIDSMVYYIKGWHNRKLDKGRGAEHIKFHLQEGSEGQITLEELLNLGHSIREYLKLFNEPFKDGNNAKIYEWENKDGIRFRVVTDKENKEDKNTKREGHSHTPLSPFDEIIITFYSDRNLKEKMFFKNPKVAEYYANKDNKDNQNNIKTRKRR